MSVILKDPVDTICSKNGNEGQWDDRKIRELRDFSVIENGLKNLSENFESTKSFTAEVNKRFKELKRDIEDEHESGLNDDLEELQKLTIKEKIMDHGRIKVRVSLDRQEFGLVTTSWPRRHSLSHEESEVLKKPLATRIPTSYSRARRFTNAKYMWYRFKDRGMKVSSGNRHRLGIGPSVESESPRGCCGPGHLAKERSLPHRTDVSPVQVDLVVSSAMETSQLMTITGTSEVTTSRPSIENESKDNDRIKFKEFLNTQDDSLAAAREWLVRNAHSQEEISLPTGGGGEGGGEGGEGGEGGGKGGGEGGGEGGECAYSKGEMARNSSVCSC